MTYHNALKEILQTGVAYAFTKNNGNPGRLVCVTDFAISRGDCVGYYCDNCEAFVKPCDSFVLSSITSTKPGVNMSSKPFAKPSDLNGLTVLDLSEKIAEFRIRAEAINTNIAEIEARAKWMTDTDSNLFNEQVYNAYRLIKAVKDQSTSDIDLAKAVADLMSKE